MDNTRIVERGGHFRVCTSNRGENFSTEQDAKAAAILCNAAYEEGQASLALDLRQLLGASAR